MKRSFLVMGLLAVAVTAGCMPVPPKPDDPYYAPVLPRTPLPAAVGVAELPSEGLDLREYLAEMEQDLIQQALDAEDGVVARAAERLNVRRTTLVEEMRKYGMSRN